MNYNPNNSAVYLAAIAGSLAGIAASGQYLSDANEADYMYPAEQADAFAQAVDTAWGAHTSSNVEILAIQLASQAVWQNGRSPLNSAVSTLESSYTKIGAAIAALVQAGNAQVVLEGVNPNASLFSGGGGSSGGPTFYSSGGPPGVATSQLFQASVVVGATGTIQWLAVTSLTGNGGTAANGDVLQAEASLNGVGIAGLNPQQALESGICSIGTIGQSGGLTPGATVNIGVICTDTTNAGHTFTGGAQILYWAL